MPETGPNSYRFRLDDHQRRLDELYRELERARDRIHTLANLCQSLPDYGRRLDDLEALKLEVLSADVKHLERRMDAVAENMVTKTEMAVLARSVSTMSKALWTAAGSIVVSALVFALSVASGQI